MFMNLYPHGMYKVNDEIFAPTIVNKVKSLSFAFT
jgi:hypothetical protein